MRIPRGSLAIVAGGLAVLSIAFGGALLYVREEVLNRSAFEDRAVTAVQKPAVRGLIADRIVDEVIRRGAPDLITARPLLRSTADAAIASEQFTVLIRIAAEELYRTLFDVDRAKAQIQVNDTARLLLTTARSVDPSLAKELPAEVDLPLATITRRDLAGGAVALTDRARSTPLWLIPAGVLLLLLNIAAARNRRRAVAAHALALSAVAVLVGALVKTRPGGVGPQGAHDVNAALDQAWSAFAGDLRTWSFIAAAFAMLGVAIASWRAPLPGGWRVGVTRFVSPISGARAAIRGVVLTLAGAALILAPYSALRTILVVLGVIFVLAGADDLWPGEAMRERASRRAASAMSRADRRWLAAAIAVTLAATGAGVLVVRANRNENPSTDAPQLGHKPTDPGATCNGLLVLCERRLNEVVFPGTHNSMSAVDHAGWLFTNQLYDIPRQLQDGIRLLLLDAHWGVKSGDTVRTDLQREGSSRNRAAGALGMAGVRTAEQFAGQIGLGGLNGPRGVYLCHTLCELGATPMSATLGALKAFLDANPRELVVISFEDSVGPQAIAREFTQAGLVPRIAVLARDVPLPTLGSLLDAGKQLIVFGNHATGGLPWYLPATSFIQDGPVAATGCDLRTGTAASPILEINHWIDSFPPRPSLAAQIGKRATLLARVRECAAARGLPVSLLAVDYYERTDVIGLARELNVTPVEQGAQFAEDVPDVIPRPPGGIVQAP